jgi:putative heme transporter
VPPGDEPGLDDAPEDRSEDGSEDPAPRPLVEPAPAVEDLPAQRVVAQLDWVSVVQVGIGVLLVWAVFGLFRAAGQTLTAIGVGVVLALALDQVVSRLQRARDWPRSVAVAVVCVALAVAATAIVLFLGPPAVRQAAQFGEELPETVEGLYDFPVVGPWLEDADAAEEVVAWVEDLPGNITGETLADLVDRIVGGTAAALIVLIVAVAVLLDGEHLVARGRRLVPARHRERSDRVGQIAYRTLAKYFAGSLLLASFTGLYVLTVGLVLGVPLAPVAALWAMITDLIPQVGGFLGGSVFVTLALTAGITTGVLALVLFVLYMSTENYVIHPAVVGKAVDLSPPTTMLAALVGGAAAGVPGALVATPMVGAAKALYTEVRFGSPDDGDVGVDRHLPLAGLRARLRGRAG